MAKTLSESAAEILNASIGKNQEPAATLGAETEDLGGATTENPYFEVIKALISRSRVFQLRNLNHQGTIVGPVIIPWSRIAHLTVRNGFNNDSHFVCSF